MAKYIRTSWTRWCKRHSGWYKSDSKFSTVCSDCNLSNKKIKAANERNRKKEALRRREEKKYIKNQKKRERGDLFIKLFKDVKGSNVDKVIIRARKKI